MITIPRTEPPPLLYKYFPPERFDVIETQEIRFSPPAQFNDTFDTYHLVPKVVASRARVERLRMRRDLGVFCLTERADNHVMWVNYAHNHTGFVIGFDATTGFFDQDERSLRKVIYQAIPPVFPEPDENGCFYKSPAWRYEEEWRSIRRFQGNENRLVSVDWPLIKQVIFGHQMAPWLISRIVLAVKTFKEGYDVGPTLLRSSPAHSEWRFVNQAKKFTSCEHCHGEGYTVSDLTDDS